ncbi:hypothetical protein M5689_013207 [Euphorbia peplus]|nr:hypothetical protein M5689_013207 [Euphorbia peplus]
MFTGDDMKEFMEEYGIKLIHSTPFYAQANGQAEASNKILIGILEKMLKENPRDWHTTLSETLWAMRMTKPRATGVSPFFLTFGHDAVLPLEVIVPSLRIVRQNDLQPDDYLQAMIMELEDLDYERQKAFDCMLVQKKKVVEVYNKKVRRKVFQEGDLVWKLILPIGLKSHELGKWSPNWEGPFQVHKVLPGNAYWLKGLGGELHPRYINGKYLKKYYQTMWDLVDSRQGTHAGSLITTP